MSEAARVPMVEGTTARRRYARYQVSIPFDVTVFRPGTVTRLGGRAQDIGEGGLRGVISGAALPGERVELVVTLPGSAQPLTMHAVVRHQGEMHSGFEFLTLEQEQREQLQRLCDDPGLTAALVNGVESEAGIAPLARTGTVVCETCGYEFPEDESMCVMCGTHQSKPEPVEEIVTERREPGKLVRPSMWATSMSASAAYYKSRGPRSSLLDSVVAVVFLVTLSVGLWQWLNSPADSNPQPSSVTVELANVLLRPVPPEPSVAGSSLGGGGGSSSGSTMSKARTLFQVEAEPIVGFNAPVPRKEPVGQPGSAAAEPRSSETRPTPAPESKAPNRDVPPRPSLSSAAGAAVAAVANTAAEQARAATTQAASAATTQAASAPTALDLGSMLLQKVLPVYPTRARREGLQGQVVLKAVIGKDGNIAQLLPVQGPQELTSAAIDAVQHWRFRPYQLNGKPVEVETDIRLNFQLPKK